MTRTSIKKRRCV